ncbi:MAG: iron-sulfur cluster assembly protein [Bacteroidota bacterium]
MVAQEQEQKQEQPANGEPQDNPSLELNAPIAESRVWDVLRDCYDPEIPVNIVDLGLVYDVKVEEEIPGEANVFIVMTLTAPGCGMGPMIAADVKRRVEQIPGVHNVMVDLVFEPAWNPGMMSEAAKLILNMS